MLKRILFYTGQYIDWLGNTWLKLEKAPLSLTGDMCYSEEFSVIVLTFCFGFNVSLLKKVNKWIVDNTACIFVFKGIPLMVSEIFFF